MIRFFLSPIVFSFNFSVLSWHWIQKTQSLGAVVHSPVPMVFKFVAGNFVVFVRIAVRPAIRTVPLVTLNTRPELFPLTVQLAAPEPLSPISPVGSAQFPLVSVLVPHNGVMVRPSGAEAAADAAMNQARHH